MPKIVINTCFGGFGLSHEAHMLYAQKKGIKLYTYEQNWKLHKCFLVEGEPKVRHIVYFTQPLIDGEFDDKYYFDDNKINRDDPDLVKTVEELGEKANGDCAELEIVDVPDDVQWEIQEYDGREWIAEKHRTWHGSH